MRMKNNNGVTSLAKQLKKFTLQTIQGIEEEIVICYRTLLGEKNTHLIVQNSFETLISFNRCARKFLKI